MNHQQTALPAKVLLVDDEEEFVQTLSERLERRALQTVVAFNGVSALGLIGAENPDVMVLDLRMPGMDGMDVLRRVMNANLPVEVIILTGHGSKKDQGLAMQLGAFAYLEKPVEIKKLVSAIRDAHAKRVRDRLSEEDSDS